MNLLALFALARKDLKLFFADRKSLITTLAVPIALASFMVILFGGAFSGNGKSSRDAIDVLLLDQDNSTTSQALIKSVNEGDMVRLVPTTDSPDVVREKLQAGKVIAALVIPPDFGKNAPSALFGATDAPELTILHDPSHSMEMQVIQGALMQSGMQTVSREAFSPSAWKSTLSDNLRRVQSSANLSPSAKQAFAGLFDNVDRLQALDADRAAKATTRAAADGTATSKPASTSVGGMRAPFHLSAEAVTAKRGTESVVSPRVATVSHMFIGMATQGVLFFAIEAALSIIRDRNRGLWKRLRASPASKSTLVAARFVSSLVISCIVLGAVLLVGITVFGMRVASSVPGFLLVCLATGAMVAGLGLLIATLGRNEQQARGISIFVVLVMSMLGGAWMPSFLMPKALQSVSRVLPSRWAIDGLDLATWRGGTFVDCLTPTALLLAFAAAFTGFAVARFRWEE